MSLLLAVALATIQPACSWDRPGANRYTGSSGSAIDGYTGMPEAVRNTLKRRVEENQPDDMVAITRDTIQGKHQYDPAIRDMHFGSASVCRTVTRDKWAANRVEPGAVYCVGRHCILVPKICGNISRVARLAPPTETAAAPIPPPLPMAYEFDEAARRKELGLIDAEGRDQDDVEREVMLDEIRLKIASLTQDGLSDRVPHGGRGLDGPPDASGAPSAVPEADSWTMLLGGLGLLGLLGQASARRHRPKR